MVPFFVVYFVGYVDQAISSPWCSNPRVDIDAKNVLVDIICKIQAVTIPIF